MDDHLDKSKKRLLISLVFRFVIVALTVVLFFLFFK